jgi:hypothetical protein
MGVLLGLGIDSGSGTLAKGSADIAHTTGGYTSNGAGIATSIHCIQNNASSANNIRMAVYSADGLTLLDETPEIPVSANGEYSGIIDVPIEPNKTYLLCLHNDFTFQAQTRGGPRDRTNTTHTFGAFPATVNTSAGTLNSEIVLWLEGTEFGNKKTLLFPNDRLSMPELLIPGRKPTGPVTIDWDNPLSKGLKRFYLLGPTFIGDLVSSKTLAFAGTDFPRTHLDGAISFNGTNNYAYHDNGQMADVIYDGATLIADPKLKSGAADAFHTVYRHEVGGTNKIEIIRNSISNKWEFNILKGSESVCQSIDDSVNGELVTLAGTYDKTTAKLYKNGILQDTQTAASGSIGAIGDSMHIGSWEGTADFFDGFLNYAIVYDRALEESEILSLFNDPYQFLKPAQ